jgi:hypothetical protein
MPAIEAHQENEGARHSGRHAYIVLPTTENKQLPPIASP